MRYLNDNADNIIIKSIYNRREFLKRGGQALGVMALAQMGLQSCSDSPLFCQSREGGFVRPAKRWKSLSGTTVRCLLCPNGCELADGDRGICRARENRGGRLYTLVYGRIAASHVDPIEKKPLYHFLPGSRAFSVATAGCNLSCKFCQNWQLSQSSPEELDARYITPAALSSGARSSGAPVIAYTYNEPTVQYEYIVDSSRAAKKRGLRPVIISNGYILPKAGKTLARGLDAIKIDLKSFSDSFYRDICGGNLKSVLNNLEAIHSTGTWLEIVVLVIPTLNDSPAEIKKMAAWIVKNLSPNVPVHFTRFHAMYKIRNLPPTPVKTLERCRTIAKGEGIRYPYVGNVPGHRWENTCCHKCNKLIIKRSGYFHIVNSIKNGRCPFCKTAVPGVWI